jgi:hypothetical protein
MNSADTEPGIESELLDLSTVPFERLRALNSTVLHQAMHHVLEHTGHLRAVRRSETATGGERID